MQKFFVTQTMRGEEALGYLVEADMFTIESSGALSFWKVIVRGELSELVLAVNAVHWLKVEKTE